MLRHLDMMHYTINLLYQTLISGLRELHDKIILNDPVLNPANNKGIVAVYNNIKRNMETVTLEDYV